MILVLLMIFMLFLAIIVSSEFAAYLWHRYGAHSIPGPHQTHQTHHTADLTHEAHHDFYWVIMILLLIGLGLFSLWYGDYLAMLGIPAFLVFIIYALLFLVYTWNWYIHSAYHIPHHWLNKYQWFRTDKRIHLHHHVNPEVNYGIASHFSDIILGTYERPSNNPAEVFNRNRKSRLKHTNQKIYKDPTK